MRKIGFKITFLVLNCALLAFCIAGLTLSMTSDASFFSFFTNISNLIMSLVCIGNIVFTIISFFKDVKCKLMKILNNVAISGVLLTFTTVLFVLLPIYGIQVISSFKLVTLHLVTPLLSLSLIFFDTNKAKYKIVETLYSIIPVCVYGAIILWLVAVDYLKPPYSFFDFKNNDPMITVLALIGMILLTALISYTIQFVASKMRYLED